MRLGGGTLLTGIAILGILSACGGADGKAAPAPPAPRIAPAPAPTTPVTPPPAPNAGDLLEKGKLLYEKTAGGVGCASCHGLDGKGGGAPYIQGASKAQLRQALAGGAQAMTFIKLNDAEVDAVVAYLEYLSQQP